MKSKQTFDIEGKTRDEVMAIAEAQMREFVEGKLQDYSDTLLSNGATPPELSAEMERARADLEASVAGNMVRLRAWLARGAEPFH